MALRYRRCIYIGKLHWEDIESVDHTWKYDILVRGSFGCKISDQIRTGSLAEKDAFLFNLVRVYGFIKAQAYAI